MIGRFAEGGPTSASRAVVGQPDTFSGEQGAIIAVPNEPHLPFDAQLRHFKRVVAGEELPIVSALEGTRNLRVLEAIQDSSRSGRKIGLS